MAVNIVTKAIEALLVTDASCLRWTLLPIHLLTLHECRPTARCCRYDESGHAGSSPLQAYAIVSREGLLIRLKATRLMNITPTLLRYHANATGLL